MNSNNQSDLNGIQQDISQSPDLQHLSILKQTIADTMNHVQQIESKIKAKVQGIPEEGRQTILNDVKEKLVNAKQEINESFEKQQELINSTFEKLMDRVNELKVMPLTSDGRLQNQDQAASGHQVTSRKKIFSQKIFYERDSLLTYSNGDDRSFRTLENIFVAFLILLGVQICVDEYFENGNLMPDLELFYYVFGQFDKVVICLFEMWFISFLSVYMIQIVKNYKLSYMIYIPAYALIQLTILSVGVLTCYYYGLQPASALVVSCEMARSGMKTHAYIREKIINGINRNGEIALFIPEWAKKQGVKVEDLDQPDISIGTFKSELKKFAYFFVAPTLIYRDNYPRNRKIRMSIVLRNMCTWTLLIFYLWSVFKALCIPIFKHTVNNPGSLRQFIASVIFSSVSGIICLLTLFYGMLHSWFNIFGELLRFGDRLFYEDWWNVKDFAGYYRKWNIVVHEFLYYYIYQDCIRFSKGRMNRQNAKYMVFFISAVIHEIIVTCGLGFFFPILFLLFGGPGVIFTRIKFGTGSYVGTLFWFLMLIGSGILMVLICREYYARQHPSSPLLRDGFMEFIYPQSLKLLREQQS